MNIDVNDGGVAKSETIEFNENNQGTSLRGEIYQGTV